MVSTAEKIVLKIGLRNIFKVFSFFRSIYLLLDSICSALFGYSLVRGSKKDQQMADECGHLVRILGRGTGNPAGHTNMENFILRHEAYVMDPVDFVRNNDKVTFMGADEKQAWFSVTKATDDVYDTKKFPFAFIGQLMLSEKLLIVDHATLHRIADKLDSPSGNCIIMNNTGRSGSTLLCQMFQRVPQTLVMAEPWGLLYIHQLYNLKKLTWLQYRVLLKSCIKCQFKPSAQKKSERHVLKLPLLCASMMKPIHDIFGDKIQFMLSTRHPKPSILSFAKVFLSFEPEPIEIRGNFWFSGVGFPYGEKYQTLFDKYYGSRKEATYSEYAAAGYAACIAGYLENKSMYKITVVYEEIMKDVERKTAEMFQALGIPLEHVSESIKALSVHSQHNMFDNTKGDHGPINELEWSKVEDIFRDINVPLELSMTINDLSNIVH